MSTWSRAVIEGGLVGRVLATEIWRAERPHEHFGLGGLNSERSVRHALQRTAFEIEDEDGLPDSLAGELSGMRWHDDDPPSLLEGTEQMLVRYRPRVHGSIDRSEIVTMLLAKLLVIQSLAARMGYWTVRSTEISDAVIARNLYRELEHFEGQQHALLIKRADELYVAVHYREAALAFLAADRLSRTTAGLQKAATALFKAGNYASALWAIRVCLLEPKTSFAPSDPGRGARALERLLRRVVEGPFGLDRDAMPVDPDLDQREVRLSDFDGESFQTTQEEWAQAIGEEVCPVSWLVARPL